MRTKKQLLQIVLDKIERGDFICTFIVELWQQKEISSAEEKSMAEFMKKNTPKDKYPGDAWWLNDDIESRREWLKQQINKL